jgi:hypothetical protein
MQINANSKEYALLDKWEDLAKESNKDED